MGNFILDLLSYKTSWLVLVISFLWMNKKIWFKICCAIYNFVIVLPLTRSIYVIYANKFNKEIMEDTFSMVDIGTGTGKPLEAFMKTSKANRVSAIDINEAYISQVKELFAKDKRVSPELIDWYKFAEKYDESVPEKNKFDIVFFGFSFMLMPDRVKALRDAVRVKKILAGR